MRLYACVTTAQHCRLTQISPLTIDDRCLSSMVSWTYVCRVMPQRSGSWYIKACRDRNKQLTQAARQMNRSSIVYCNKWSTRVRQHILDNHLIFSHNDAQYQRVVSADIPPFRNRLCKDLEWKWEEGWRLVVSGVAISLNFSLLCHFSTALIIENEIAKGRCKKYFIRKRLIQRSLILNKPCL